MLLFVELAKGLVSAAGDVASCEAQNRRNGSCGARNRSNIQRLLTSHASGKVIGFPYYELDKFTCFLSSGIFSLHLTSHHWRSLFFLLCERSTSSSLELSCPLKLDQISSFKNYNRKNNIFLRHLSCMIQTSFALSTLIRTPDCSDIQNYSSAAKPTNQLGAAKVDRQ